ncbi:MAG: trehalose-phosphatase [Actinomycetota bacterium]
MTGRDVHDDLREPIDPGTLADEIAALPAPRLIVFDCDGVLAPIVAHADDAVLSPGNASALADLAANTGTHVAILSGRSLAGLAQFEFASAIDVIGSYGAERRGRPPTELAADERRRLAELVTMTEQAAETAGPGAWVEHKPASVVLHVREADDHAATLAVRRVRDDAERLHGVFVHDGDAVIELAVHRSDKGTALDALADEYAPGSLVYLGDDEPDEAAFATVAGRAEPGVSVRIGPADATTATCCLGGPDEVTLLLVDLVRRLR